MMIDKVKKLQINIRNTILNKKAYGKIIYSDNSIQKFMFNDEINNKLNIKITKIVSKDYDYEFAPRSFKTIKIKDGVPVIN